MSAPLNREIYTVSHLNQAVRTLLEGSFPLLWVQGEISNLSRPVSGHLYFSLKDAKAQVRCALFRNRSRLLRGSIANGRQVLVRARIGLYEPRGEFQLIVEHLEEAGIGALRLAYETLRLRLQEEGLFSAEHKKTLPRLPKRIGLITSPRGAAVKDVLSVLERRFPSLPVLIYPVPVQGEGAGVQIARCIALACERRDCDVLLLVRGGGSLEDLWAFNEEVVARAIHACSLPLVCGVGHETDVTIADFAADVRAPTPSAAAELVSPDRQEWLQRISQLRLRLHALMVQHLAEQRRSLQGLQQRLSRRHPGRRLQDQAQRLDEWEQRLQRAMKARLERSNQRLQTLSRALHAVSPLQVLGRGYAVIRRYPDGESIRQAHHVQPGDRVEALLAQGRLLCHVEEVKE